MPQNTVNQQSTGDIDVEQLDAYAARVLATGMCPAVAVAVCDRERTLVARTYGAAPSDALWPIASIGKSCTAVIALQLAEEGLLDLHAPVSAYVSWLSLGGARAPVTMHHLLTHTAGLVESSDLAPASTYDVIALASLQDGPAAGERRLYSNVGYRAAGVVLEAVGGRPYGELVQARVLDRIGLRHAAAVMVHDTRRRLPAGTCRSTTTGRGGASTAWPLRRGWSPRRPTDASA
jgi:CubicO group peptidase (beta-lactamase class C family)